MKNKHILISGASIAGPALGYWLNQYGFKVTIVEKAPQLRLGGYRVDVRGKAVEVATRMGIMDSIRLNATNMRGSSLINIRGERLISFDDPDLQGMRAPGDAEIMRGDLSLLLYDRTRQDIEYIFDTSIVDLVQTPDEVIVRLKDGGVRSFDLVIGADGLHSNVRRLAFGSDEEFVRSYGCYLAIYTIPNFFGLDRWEWSGFSKGAVFNIFNCNEPGKAKALFMFDAPGLAYDYRDVSQQKRIVMDRFKDEGGIVPLLLSAIPESPDFYFDSISQVHMDSLFSGRVALLGDAGYCPSPASGQGTSLALVGAYVLAGELAAAGGDYAVAFRRYGEVMKGFVVRNQELGRDGLKRMFPRTSTGVMIQKAMLWLLNRAPLRDRMMRMMFGKIQKKVDAVANGITLKDYSGPARVLRKPSPGMLFLA